MGGMQSYLKTKPVWMQLLLFMGMAIGIFLVISLFGMGLLSGMTGVSLSQMSDSSSWGNKPEMLTHVRGMLLIQFLGLFVIPSLLFAYFSDPHPMDYLHLHKPWKSIYWVIGIILLLVAIPVVEYTGLLNRKINFGAAQGWMQGMEDQAAAQIKFMLGRHTMGELITNIVFIAVFAGVGEELFFRGILQRMFIKASRNPWVGIIFTAILFSALHVQFFGFFPRLFLGILLGALYWYSGSLLVAILAHILYDAFFITLAYLQPRMIENAEATLFTSSTLPLIALLSLAITAALVWVMKKKSRSSYYEVYKNDEATNHEDFSF
jgi:membrane protease YdiL (CAAX protease family)